MMEKLQWLPLSDYKVETQYMLTASVVVCNVKLVMQPVPRNSSFSVYFRNGTLKIVYGTSGTAFQNGFQYRKQYISCSDDGGKMLRARIWFRTDHQSNNDVKEFFL